MFCVCLRLPLQQQSAVDHIKWSPFSIHRASWLRDAMLWETEREIHTASALGHDRWGGLSTPQPPYIHTHINTCIHTGSIFLGMMPSRIVWMASLWEVLGKMDDLIWTCDDDAGHVIDVMLCKMSWRENKNVNGWSGCLLVVFISYLVTAYIFMCNCILRKLCISGENKYDELYFIHPKRVYFWIGICHWIGRIISVSVLTWI